MAVLHVSQSQGPDDCGCLFVEEEGREEEEEEEEEESHWEEDVLLDLGVVEGVGW